MLSRREVIEVHGMRWAREVAVGCARSVVLLALTGILPAMSVAILFFGSRFTTSWSDGLTAAPWVVVVAALGEWALAIWWTVIASWVALFLLARPLCQATRTFLGAWTATPYPPSYRRTPPVTQMATGFWWSGYEYHQGRRQALFSAWVQTRVKDPQTKRDWVWLLLASVTVLPVAALPPAALVGAILLIVDGMAGWAPPALLVGVVATPFAWRIAAALGPRLLAAREDVATDERVQELLTTQAHLTKTQATELERVERGLHDGAQARLVALGMSLGAIERLVDRDPEAAKALLRETRDSSSAALAELRTLVRGINPPVLTERGLVDAVRALALVSPVPVEVLGELPSRPERPIESALYFTVSELLTNVAKHSQAGHATVEFAQRGGLLEVAVMDDGVGGATGSEGSGLQGVERRLEAFGGRLRIQSPPGGGTRISVTVPCASS